MKLARPPFAVHTSEIINPISHVAALLYLADKTTRTDTMYPPGRQIIYVARTHVITPEHFGQSLVGHARRIFVRCHLPAEPIQQVSSRCPVHHVPHLRLARAAVAALRQLVIRMHLHGKRLGRIDKFDKQGKTCAEAFEVLLAQQSASALLGQLRKGHPVVRTACHNRFIARNSGQFPTLTYQPFIGFQPLERKYAVSSPQGFLEYIRKTEQFIFHIPSVKNRPKLRNSYNTSK